MVNRITVSQDDSRERLKPPTAETQPIGEILEELLAQYQARFPDLRILLVETSANAL